MESRVASVFVALTLLSAVSWSTASAQSGGELAKLHGFKIQPAAADGVPIRVVDANGKPVSDALVVRVVEADFAANYADMNQSDLDSFEVLRQIGMAHVTASDGTTRVKPPFDWTLSVFAFRGRDFGRATLELHDGSEHVIVIEPRELPVQVVDAAGKPQAGVPIALGRCALEPQGIGAWQRVTDADGRVAIPALDLERHVHRTCGHQVHVKLALPIEGHALRALDAPRLEPVRFVLPDCGEAVVEILDASGKPYPAKRLRAKHAALFVAAKPSDRIGLEREATPSGEEMRVLLDENHIQLPHLAIGTPLWLEVAVPKRRSDGGARFDWTDWANGHALTSAITISGPTKAGEIVRVVLRADPNEETDEVAPVTPTAPNSEEHAAEPADEPAVEPEDDADRARAELSSLAVQVLVDVPIQPLELRPRLRRESETNPVAFDPKVDPDASAESWIDAVGHTTIRRVPAGRWIVAFTVNDLYLECEAKNVVAEVGPIDVAARSFVRDPRLLAVDLRGKFRRRHVDVVDAEGRPLRGLVRFKNVATAKLEDERWFDQGVVDFLTAVDDHRALVVAVDRFRPAEVDGIAATARVVLKRGIPIRVVLDPKFTLPKEPLTKLYVGVSEVPRCGMERDPTAEEKEARTVAIEPGGSARFNVPEPGDWRVVFLSTSNADEDSRDYRRCDAKEPTIHVVDGDAEQVFTVAPASLAETKESDESETSGRDP